MYQYPNTLGAPQTCTCPRCPRCGGFLPTQPVLPTWWSNGITLYNQPTTDKHEGVPCTVVNADPRDLYKVQTT